MTAFDKAWGVAKEDECEGDCNGCEYHPDQCNCRGCTDGGSKSDWCWRAGRPVDKDGNIEFKKAWGIVKEDEKIAVPVRKFWKGPLLGFDILGLEAWLKANFNGYNEEISLQDNILAASGPQTLALVMDLLSRRDG